MHYAIDRLKVQSIWCSVWPCSIAYQAALRKQKTLLQEAIEEINEYCEKNAWLVDINKFCKQWNDTSVLQWRNAAAFTIEVGDSPYLSRLPWIFPGAPLKVNEAPRNIQGNLSALTHSAGHLTVKKWSFLLLESTVCYNIDKSIVLCTTVVSLLMMQWRYHSFALSHPNVSSTCVDFRFLWQWLNELCVIKKFPKWHMKFDHYVEC